MTGFTSEDHQTNSMSYAGKTFAQVFSKQFNPTAAAVANEWHTLFRGGGHPQADAIFDVGTALQFQSVCDQLASGNLYHGGVIGAAGDDFKILVSGFAVTAASTVVPALLMVVDVLGFYRVTAVTTTTEQATTNSNTFIASSSSGLLLIYANDWQNFTKVQFTNSGGALPTGLSINTDYWLVRQSASSAKVATSFANAIAGIVVPYTDAGTGTHTLTARLPRYSDGKGVQAIFFNPQATALGAGTPGLSLNYTNSNGTASRATPSSPSLPIGKTAATNSHILYSGATGAGKFGPFMPLQGADGGIQSIQGIRNNASYTSGMYSVALVKPLAEFPLQVLGQAQMIDFTRGIQPSHPRVYDGAALYFLLKSGVATPTNSAIDGKLTFGWGA